MLAAVAITLVAPANAQPNGWSGLDGFAVTETSGVQLTNYAVKLSFDSQTLITGGLMNSDASDLRFGDDCLGSNLYDYYLEPSTINTATTVAWVNVPTLPANGTVSVYMYYTNVNATAVSSLSIFSGPHSATDDGNGPVTGGLANAVSDSGRAFRFTPKQDILITELGKSEPDGTARYITIWEVAGQTKLYQHLSSAGVSGQYIYDNASDVFWLKSGQEYLSTLFQGAGESYYYKQSTQINSAYLTYGDMRYCNSCTKDSYPTNTVANYQYGYTDFIFYARQTAASEPTIVPTACTESATCDSDCTAAQCGDGTLNVTAGETCDGDGNGNGGETATCNSDCTAASCGDGKVNLTAGETCDGDGMGNGGETANCDADCSVATCGDGNINVTAGETCDGDGKGNGGETYKCDTDCSAAACGDGILNMTAGETCDGDGMGNGGETASCNSDCSTASCGDGVVNMTAGEDCDGDGKGNGGESVDCNADCSAASCGDGIINTTAGEDCDEEAETASCDSNCTKAECGDGTVNKTAGEVCDDGNMTNNDGCPDGDNGTCKDAICGDGFVKQSSIEECDEGSDNSDTEADACRTDCTDPGCGDGVIDTGEECDDGPDNGKGMSTCSATCQPKTTMGMGGGDTGGSGSGNTGTGAGGPRPTITDEGGCSCGLPGRESGRTWAALLAIALLGGALGRRRQRRA